MNCYYFLYCFVTVKIKYQFFVFASFRIFQHSFRSRFTAEFSTLWWNVMKTSTFLSRQVSSSLQEFGGISNLCEGTKISQLVKQKKKMNHCLSFGNFSNYSMTLVLIEWHRFWPFLKHFKTFLGSLCSNFVSFWIPCIHVLTSGFQGCFSRGCKTRCFKFLMVNFTTKKKCFKK